MKKNNNNNNNTQFLLGISRSQICILHFTLYRSTVSSCILFANLLLRSRGRKWARGTKSISTQLEDFGNLSKVA